MSKSKSSKQVLCSCGCTMYVSRRTQTRHLQGKGPTLALAGVFETRSYFGTTPTNGPGAGHLDGEARPSKRRRIATLDPGPPPSQPSPQPTPDPDGSLLLDVPPIIPDELLARRWTGHRDSGDSDDNISFEGHRIPELTEISGSEREGSDLDSEDQWDDEVSEDLLEVLETNIELDVCGAGARHLQVPRAVC